MEDPAESEPPPPKPNRPVILETVKESYMLSLTHGSEFSSEGRKYDISLILEGEVEEDREDAVVLVVADKNAKKAIETPPPSPPSDEEPGEIKSEGGDENQDKSDSTTKVTSKLPSSNTPRTDSQPTNTDSSAAKIAPTVPPTSNEDVPMADASVQKMVAEKPGPTAKPVRKFKHPVAQVLQRRVGEDMFKFMDEGISIADGEDGMTNEWLVQVKSWKWATRKIVRV
jgi:hypothetical protein